MAIINLIEGKRGPWGVAAPIKTAKEVEASNRRLNSFLNKYIEICRNEMKEENSNADQDPNYN